MKCVAKKMQSNSLNGAPKVGLSLLLDKRSKEESEYSYETIKPTAGFVIKTCNVVTKTKVFINVCSYDKVEKWGYVGVNEKGEDVVRIPMSIGRAKEDLDNKLLPCVVYDIVINSDCMYDASKDDEVKQLVVNFAINAIANKFNVQLQEEVVFPKLLYKGTVIDTHTIRLKREPQIVEVASKTNAEYKETAVVAQHHDVEFELWCVDPNYLLQMLYTNGVEAVQLEPLISQQISSLDMVSKGVTAFKDLLSVDWSVYNKKRQAINKDVTIECSEESCNVADYKQLMYQHGYVCIAQFPMEGVWDVNKQLQLEVCISNEDVTLQLIDSNKGSHFECTLHFPFELDSSEAECFLYNKTKLVTLLIPVNSIATNLMKQMLTDISCMWQLSKKDEEVPVDDECVDDAMDVLL